MYSLSWIVAHTFENLFMLSNMSSILLIRVIFASPNLLSAFPDDSPGLWKVVLNHLAFCQSGNYFHMNIESECWAISHWGMSQQLIFSPVLFSKNNN